MKPLRGINTLTTLGQDQNNQWKGLNSGSENHALGGIMTRPYLGLVAEAGPEVIIPLSSRLRGRATALWQQTEQMLETRTYATGGFTGQTPAMAGVGEINVISNNNVVWGPDEDTLALQIGRKIVRDIRQAIQNKG